MQDVDTIRSLEEALLDFAGCVVVVSHDRYFLDRICTHILAYEGDGTGRVTFFPGNYQEYATWRATAAETGELPKLKATSEGSNKAAASFAKMKSS